MFEKLRKSSGRLLSALYAALLVNTAAAAVISASPAESNNNAASAGGPSRALMQDKWWDSTDANGHTVYFYDKEFRNSAISAHVWNRTEGSQDTPYYPWDEREQLKFTGKQVVIDGTAYPLYEYDFWYFGGEPTNLLFHNLSPYYGNPFTGDLEFVEGALYGYKGNGVVTQAIPDPEIVP